MTSKNAPKIVALLLAAGYSKRLGYPKQNLVWQNGLSLLESTARKLQECNVHSLWITSNEDTVLNFTTRINSHHVKVTNRDNLGIGSSLRKGLQAILTSEKDLAACLIAVCDQACIASHQYQSLLTQFELSQNIVCARYAGSFGVPCVIPNTYFNDLLNLTADYGAKKIIQKELHKPAKVCFIDIDAAEFDIDTETDLKKARDYQKIQARSSHAQSS